VDRRHEHSLNAICPYFTMFPLSFPAGVLKRHATKGDRVLDPFCGRGTTNYAARSLGLETLGIDSSPVAAAITAAKMSPATVKRICDSARRILANDEEVQAPKGEFWNLAFHSDVLHDLCKLRAAFLRDCSSDARIALRGIVLGALHGPRQKLIAGYLSNQCFRTYAPKPSYAVRFWKRNRLKPPRVDVMDVISRRAYRYFAEGLPRPWAHVEQGDSRRLEVIRSAAKQRRFNWVITSPPYYGMRTYVQDQWLRNWFLGGPEFVDYKNANQLEHTGCELFASELHAVWKNCAAVCSEDASMVVRFGAIRDREVDAKELIRLSLKDSGWKVQSVFAAGTAENGKRQARSFLAGQYEPMNEYDVWARRRS
jgi:DNA modification methylase